jgi:hypothetical protein
MGRSARDSGNLRQDRKTPPRGLRSGERAAGRPATGEKTDRAVTGRTLDLIASDGGTAATKTAGRMLNNGGGAVLARGFVLQGFDRETEELRVELHLKPAPIERLRALFDVGDDHAMANAYALDPASARGLQDLVSERIDTAKYDFFLQRYA